MPYRTRGVGGGLLELQKVMPAIKPSASAATTADAQRFRDAEATGVETTSVASVEGSSRRVRASPMSRSLFLRFLVRHLSRSRRTLGGVCGGKRFPIRLGAQDGGQRVGDVFALEESPAGEHFEDNGAERPDVGPLVHLFSLRLLRGHVGGRSQDDTRRRLPCERGRLGKLSGRIAAAFARVRFRQTEVQHLDPAVGCDLDVAGLQVTVDDALFVSLLDSFGHLSSNVYRLVDGNRTFREPRGKVFTLDELHHQKQLAIGLFQSVERGNAGVIQGPEQLRFAAQPCEPLRVLRKFFREDLDGDVAAEASCLGRDTLYPCRPHQETKESRNSRVSLQVRPPSLL